MLATAHWGTDAVGDIIYQSANVMPRLEWHEWSWQRVVLLHGRGWKRAGGSLLCLPDPLSNQKVYRGFERAAVGIQKKKRSQGNEREDETQDKVGMSALSFQRSPSLHLWAHPLLSAHCSQISIYGSNETASGPCGQSRGRPVIKMKWAADPTVPFRRVEH